MISPRTRKRALWFSVILFACSIAILITVYTCGTATTGHKIQVWVTALLTGSLLLYNYLRLQREAKTRETEK